jgi:peroxiredoxin
LTSAVLNELAVAASFELLSDGSVKLAHLMYLPTLTVAGTEFCRLVVEDSEIVKVFYPVFPPESNADDVLTWLRKQAGLERSR